jgi:hypothetical protein
MWEISTQFDSRTRQGIIMALLALLLMLVILGLMIEGLVIMLRVNTLQNAVDDGAVVAALQMNRELSHDAVRETVMQIIQQQNVQPDRVFVDTCQTIPRSSWNQPEYAALECQTSRSNRIRVYAEQVQPTLFVQLIGLRTLTIRAAATAEIATARLR